MDKQIFNLIPEDLTKNPVWFFPMDETVEDEETIRSVNNESQIGNYQIIVKTIFKAKTGEEYLGYIFWGEPQKVEHIKPVMFFDNSGDTGIVFWNGMIEPEEDDFFQAREFINSLSFPIAFSSEEIFGLYSIRGELNGIYYIDNSKNVLFKKFHSKLYEEGGQANNDPPGAFKPGFVPKEPMITIK